MASDPRSARRWCLGLLLCLYGIGCAAAQTDSQREWTEFRDKMAGYAAGPTGLYAIQHMKMLTPGESAHLSAAPRSTDRRWEAGTGDGDAVRIECRDGQALVSAPNLARTDLLKQKDGQLKLASGLIIGATAQRGSLKAWLLNPELPAARGFEGLTWFAYDPKGAVTGTFRRREKPVGVNHLDSRQQAGLMYWIGDIDTTIAGKPYRLRAFNYQKDWAKIDHLLILLRDKTSGRTSYGGGRVVELHFPKGKPPDTVSIDFNRLYSFLCAHSDYFNCPINLTDYVGSELRFGERYPASVREAASGESG